MAKKKKTALKPVARGFATTSIPKKVAEEASPDKDDTPVTLAECSTEPDTSALNAPLNNLENSNNFDLEKAAEEQSLQNLVDKFQEKTEKEISRTIKIIEYDRRFAKALPSLDLDPIIRERIHRLALNTERTYTPFSLEQSENKILPKLAITYGVLRRLGFSEDRVMECLQAIGGAELDDAVHWLYLHCPEEELLYDKDQTDSEPKTPRTPRTPFTFSQTTPPTPSATTGSNQLESRTTISIHSRPATPSELLDSDQPALPVLNVAQEGSERDLIKSRILSGYSSDGSEEESMDVNYEYAITRLRLEELQKQGRGSGNTMDEITALNAQLQILKQNYFYDRKQADAEYLTGRRKAMDARLRSTSSTSPVGLGLSPFNLSAVPKNRASKAQPTSFPDAMPAAPVLTVADAQDEDEETMFGTMLDEMPATEAASNGTTITLRNMALPKHLTGKTPKVVLSEVVLKSDRIADITYYQIGGASRAMRAGVSIRWTGGRTKHWEMESEGCHDLGQAEQFIATVALHGVTFPDTVGFAGGSSASGNPTYFRLLPPVFRDLWDELEAKRKAAEDALNRAAWARLRLLRESHSAEDDQTTKVNNVRLPAVSGTTAFPRSQSVVPDQPAEHLMNNFESRRASQAYQDMLPVRNSLPIAAYRERILETLENSQILVLSGETGCGKSTQIPAYILEDHLSRGKPCRIYCTEPRRIAAISLAQRVSRELGDAPGQVGTNASLVGYAIRLESHTSRTTRLTYVTNGIALRMLEGGTGQGSQGTAFDEITHIIIDEVHERSIESDFLLIVLKSMLEQRHDLKVILMSATVDANKIANFFGGCPTLHVPGRTFPVDTQYLEDAIEFTKWSLVGTPYKRYDDKFKRKNKSEWNEDTTVVDEDDESTPNVAAKMEKRYSASTVSTVNDLDERQIPYELIIRILERLCFEDRAYASYSAAMLIFMPGLAEIRRLHDMLADHKQFRDEQLFRIHPLHSTIASENQAAVFDIPPHGVRKIVIASNIAETGITIPDITCVIDTGKHREMRFDEKRQISRLIETFIAKSNAAQRRGRAGRVQNGLCFHLFTKARHDLQMVDHPQPEMLRLSLSDLALRIKILNIKLGNSIEDVLSRALDPPSQVNVQRAVSALVEVKALTPAEEITPMGRLLSKLPTDVHLGKFLLISALFGCLDPALTIAATLNSKSPFVTPFGHEDEADRAKASFRVHNSDFLTIHNAFSSWRKATSNSGIKTFCRRNYLSHQNLQQIEELRQQFLGYLTDSQFLQVDKAFGRELSRARYGRHKTRFVTVPPHLDRNSDDHLLINAALVAGLYPKVLSIDEKALRTITNNQLASLHPSSVNARRPLKEFGVNYLCYFTIMHSKKLYAWETGPIEDVALILLCGEADFKLISDSLFLDRKIRFRIGPKSNLALKLLRDQLSTILACRMRGKPLTETQQAWYDLATLVLGKAKVDPLDGDEAGLVMNVNLMADPSQFGSPMGVAHDTLSKQHI